MFNIYYLIFIIILVCRPEQERSFPHNLELITQVSEFTHFPLPTKKKEKIIIN